MDHHTILALFHIFVVVPLFLFVGLQRAAMDEWVYTLLLVLGSVILLYHGYKAYVRFMASSPLLWVNLFHVALIAPLLIYIGSKGKNTERPAYELLLMAAFSAGGYHIYSLIQQMNNVKVTSPQ